MARQISVRELRNQTAQVVAAVKDGERLELTVNRQPVADIVPHSEERSPWVPAAVVMRIRAEAPLDPEFLDDVADMRKSVIEEPDW